MESEGFSVLRIRIRVSSSSVTPSRARYSHCIGTRTESLATRAFKVRRSNAGGQSMMMNSYGSRTWLINCFIRNSLFSTLTSSTVAPTRFLSAGIRSRPSTCVLRRIRWMGSSRIRALYRDRRAGSLGKPKPPVVLLWGSQSTTSVFRSAAAREAPRLIAVVVFPTPPFWLAMAIIRPKLSPQSGVNLADMAAGRQDVSRGTKYWELADVPRGTPAT